LKHQFDHLTVATAELLNLSNDQRIKEVQSERWVHYPRAKAALVAMGRLAAHPRTTRMPSLAIYGDSGMGKTMLMQKFCEDHPPLVDPRKGIERQQILPIQFWSSTKFTTFSLAPPASSASFSTHFDI
jgi:predicted ATPase